MHAWRVPGYADRIRGTRPEEEVAATLAKAGLRVAIATAVDNGGLKAQEPTSQLLFF